jgi:hypothetical protein
MQTGKITLAGRTYAVHELPPICYLQFRLWLQQQARDAWQPWDYVRWKMAGLGVEVARDLLVAVAPQVPVYPPEDFVRELLLGPVGARALASLMILDLPEAELPAAIDERNAAAVAVYLLDHMAPELVRIEGNAVEQLEQLNARRAAAGLAPVTVGDGGRLVWPAEAVAEQAEQAEQEEVAANG